MKKHTHKFMDKIQSKSPVSLRCPDCGKVITKNKTKTKKERAKGCFGNPKIFREKHVQMRFM